MASVLKAETQLKGHLFASAISQAAARSANFNVVSDRLG